MNAVSRIGIDGPMVAGQVLDDHPVFDAGILRGFHLLESDAGTGKTWTIAGLVVRALLERELDIDRILVVTFTNAATAELAARIRDRIAMLARLLEDTIAGRPSPVDELFCVEYLPRVVDRQDALGRLRIALSRIDEAAVRTIHGFCQRVIDEYGLTTGLPGGIEVAPGDGRWIDALVSDWWRREIVSAGPAELALLAASGATPRRVARLLHAIHANPAALRRSRPVDWRELAARFAALRERLATAIASEHDPFVEWIRTKGNVDSKKVGGTQHVQGRLAKLREWCTSGDHGAASTTKARGDLGVLVQRLSRECIEGAGSGRPLPSFGLPVLCSELLPLLADCDAVAGRIAEEIWAASEVQRLERRSSGAPLGFDELLSIVHDTLADPGRGPELAQALRERHPLALVDECQDTDSLQWQIFRRIYLDAGEVDCGLVLVGDPKQAIYAFRGADVYSYLEARGAGPREHALRENQRSVPRLVAAVNALFSVGRPFGVDGIDFVPAAVGRRRRRALEGPGADRAPLAVLRFDGRAPGEPMGVDQASRIAAAITATEIARLLGGGLRLGDRPLAPADVAVLVDSHQQATRIKRALGAQGIGAVEISRDSVLDSPEAFELMRWLAAIADPADAGRLRSALATSMAGLDAAALEALASDAGRWNDWVEHFGACRDDWPRLGAHASLRRLLFATGVPARLARLRDGERRLTNLLHLLELLADADEAVQGPRQAARWLARRQASADGAAREALELRLDSDENLVRILTVHKSKGLEFPFVFLPFAWQARKPKAEPPLLHHIGPDSLSGHSPQWQPVLELGERADERAAAQVVHEAETESVRRLYVALTRAEQRCYLLWGPVKSNAETPLGHLLASFDGTSGSAAAAVSTEAAAPPSSTIVDDPFALACAIERWRDAAGPGEVEIVDCDATSTPTPIPTPTPTAAPRATAAARFAAPERLLQARSFDVDIGRPWIRTSFSAIVARASGQQGADAGAVGGETEPQPDRDQHADSNLAGLASGPEPVAAALPRAPNAASAAILTRAPMPAAAPTQLELDFDADSPALDASAAAVPADRDDRPGNAPRVEHAPVGGRETFSDGDIRASFPAGARAGACLHAILERTDFELPLDRALVRTQLDRAGFGGFDADAVAGWLDATIEAPLIAPDGQQIVLRGLRAAAVVREMDFHLSARGVDERKLFEAVAAEYPLDARAPRSGWDGLLRGFVDMIFERGGRWYVLDWKSNRLGDAAGAYTEGAIDAAMSAHAYSLQACLYLLVLHRLLRQRLPGYDWDRHVGGAFWVFLRGVRPPAQGQCMTPGVHASKPSRALIERLDRLFDGTLDRAVDAAVGRAVDAAPG